MIPQSQQNGRLAPTDRGGAGWILNWTFLVAVAAVIAGLITLGLSLLR
jgi:hypothetical protein